MSNFNLRPIPKEIRYKLLQKQKAFARQSITAASSANESLKLDDDFLQFHNRATWAHMIGLTVIPGEDGKERIAIIGAGELNQEPAANEPLMKSSFDSIYSSLKDSKNTLYRPISGIKSISTRYEGTLKSRRECTVNFTIFSLEDLDRLSPYYFRVGSEVLVEFGWNVATNKDSSMFNTSLGHKIIQIYNEKGVTGLRDPSITDLLKNNTAENYENEILKHNGDYEYILGQISNFEYSLRADGGFDCVVKIQTIGMSLLDTKVDREYSPSAISAGDPDKKPMFTLPDDPSDEFYLMMDNLPEIIFGSLIQKYAESLKPPAPLQKQKTLRELEVKNYSNYLDLLIGNGIDARDAAWGLMGGSAHGMPTVPGPKIENQKFVLALMAETLVHGFGFWTDYEPLVAVFQEALLERDYKLPNYGPDGSWGSESVDATIKFIESEGEEIFKEFFTNLRKEAHKLPVDSSKIEKHESQKVMLRIITNKGSIENLPGQEHLRVSGDTYENLSKKFLREGGDIYGKSSAKSYALGSGRKLYSDDEVKEPYLIAPKTSSWSKINPATTKTESVEDSDNTSIASKFYTSNNIEGTIPNSKLASGDYGKVMESGEEENNITIFTSYRERNTTQIFTGFNWAKSIKDFDGLSEKYAGETYRDNLFVPKTKEQKKAAEKAGDAAFIATDNSGKGSDEFLEFVDPDGTVPSKIWIRWGWFEDNILTRYLGYTPGGSTGGSPVSLFKSVEPKIEMDTGKVIKGYESNKIGLPGPLLTTDVNQIIIPGRTKTLENTFESEVVRQAFFKGFWSRTDKEWEKIFYPPVNSHNFYASLGVFLNDTDSRIPEVEIGGGGNEKYKVGYIRNLYVEASTLQEAFLNIGTLKEGIDKFITIMYNNFGKIHKLEVQQGRDDNMVGIVDTNLIYNEAIWKTKDKKNILKLEDEASQINVFEFPAWEKESIVKSQDLKVTIPNEMALTALYSGNEHVSNLGIYDESRGSVEAQKLSKFLRLDHAGKDMAKGSVSDRFSRLSPIINSKNLTFSGEGRDEIGLHKYNKAGDMALLLNRELLRSMGSNSITSTGLDVDARNAVDNKLTDNNITVMKASFKNAYYNSKGTLEENAPFNMRRLMEYELQYHGNSAVQNNYPTINGLLNLSLTIDGTAGIFPGNSYISKYLPKAWQARTIGKGKDEYPVLFQATDVSHEISSDGWNTVITGMPRMNPNAFPYVYKVDPTSDGETGIVRGPETAISDYYNFFNLKFEFVKLTFASILFGINTQYWSPTTDKNSTKDFQGHFMNIGIENALREKVKTVSLRGKAENGISTSYANFTEVYKALKDGPYTIPGKKVKQTHIEGSKSEISPDPGSIPEYSMNSLEVLLFLQMSMIISGLTYFGKKDNFLSIDKAFYNEMLADTDFQTHRPGALHKQGNLWSIPVSQEKTEKGEKILSREYFTSVDHGALMNTKNIKHTNYFYSSISPFTWSKKEYFTENEVDLSRRLIGPAKFTPPGNVLTPDTSTSTSYYGGGVSSFGSYPSNDVLHMHESIFKTILKNEFGVDSWGKFNKIIALATNLTKEDNLDDYRLLIDSEKLFKYALECEYLIAS